MVVPQKHEVLEVEQEAPVVDPVTLNAVLIFTSLWELLTVWGKKSFVFLREQSIVGARYASHLWESRIKIFLIETWREFVHIIQNSSAWKQIVQKIENWTNTENNRKVVLGNAQEPSVNQGISNESTNQTI
jgi:isochorismate synthase EntC